MNVWRCQYRNTQLGIHGVLHSVRGELRDKHSEVPFLDPFAVRVCDFDGCDPFYPPAGKRCVCLFPVASRHGTLP